jgi:tripartite-type tricarboxylate transporter receptor subunit TctC
LVVAQRIGVLVPAGTPATVTTRLNTEINSALRDDKIRKSFVDQAQEPAGGTQDQYATLVRDDSAKYARLVQDLNIEMQQ